MTAELAGERIIKPAPTTKDLTGDLGSNLKTKYKTGENLDHKTLSLADTVFNGKTGLQKVDQPPDNNFFERLAVLNKSAETTRNKLSLLDQKSINFSAKLVKTLNEYKNIIELTEEHLLTQLSLSGENTGTDFGLKEIQFELRSINTLIQRFSELNTESPKVIDLIKNYQGVKGAFPKKEEKINFVNDALRLYGIEIDISLPKEQATWRDIIYYQRDSQKASTEEMLNQLSNDNYYKKLTEIISNLNSNGYKSESQELEVIKEDEKVALYRKAALLGIGVSSLMLTATLCIHLITHQTLAFSYILGGYALSILVFSSGWLTNEKSKSRHLDLIYRFFENKLSEHPENFNPLFFLPSFKEKMKAAQNTLCRASETPLLEEGKGIVEQIIEE